MITSRRSRFGGYTFDEKIEDLVDDLQLDEKDPGMMIDIARNEFGLEGDDLARGVRAILLALMKAGARPGVHSRGTPEKYILLPGYGETPEGITDTLMRHYQENGYPGRYKGECTLILQEWFKDRRTAEDIAREEDWFREQQALADLYRKKD